MATIHLLAIAAFVSLQGILSDAHYHEDINEREFYSEECWSNEDEPQCLYPNEVYDPCFSPCLQKRCDYDPRLVKCAPAPKIGDPGCVAGCRCAKGYVLNGRRCIREKDCKKICKKPHEVYDPCPGTCPRRVCGFGDRRVRCERQPKPGDPKCKQPACRCKNGYYRDDKGNCVLWKKCPVCRNTHEVYDPCFSPCLQRSCGHDPRLVKCAPPPKLGDPGCVAGCRCANGYVRNGTSCILESECLKVACEDADNQAVRLEQGNYDFAGKMLYQIMKANPGTSVVTSSCSVMPPLGLLALYSKGDTFSEIMKILNLNTKQQIRCSFPPFLDEVKASNGTELSLATKVYVKKEYELSEPFKNDAKNVFNAEGESIDFNNVNQAADTINQWVSGATKGKITELATPGMFDSLTRLALANAIYFKGTWKNEFDPDKTTNQDFYIDSQTTKKVDMMVTKDKLNYKPLPDLDAQAVELPYEDGNISFVIILPAEIDGISNLVEKLQDGAILEAAVNDFKNQVVNLRMPKFKTETKSVLKVTLKEIGVKTIFDVVKSQLDGMILPDEPLYATDAVLKATITVDEKGSEATGSNVIVIGTKSGPITVKADHPFVYVIKVGKIILFCGIYSG